MESVANQSPDSARVDQRKSAAGSRKSRRSAVSNGHDLLPNVDGRSLIARRYRDISSAIIVDQGGFDRCSESRLQLIRRFAAAAVLAEQLESKLTNGEQIDIAQHAALSSTLVRLASRIGIGRAPHDVTPTLSDYCAPIWTSAAVRKMPRREISSPAGEERTSERLFGSESYASDDGTPTCE